MALAKHEDFKNVNDIWSDYDLIIHTGTLTAGISYELQHFDMSINYYCHGSSDAI